jgi:hypothetical protein
MCAFEFLKKTFEDDRSVLQFIETLVCFFAIQYNFPRFYKILLQNFLFQQQQQ